MTLDRGAVKSMTRRWLVGLPFSIALHTALAVAAIAFLRVEQTPTGLIVDLSAIVAGREDGSPRSDGAPAPAPPTSSAAARSRSSAPPARATASPRASHEPAPGPATEPATDTATAHHEEWKTPLAVRETVPPPRADPSSNSSSSIALTTTPDEASGALASAQGAEPGGTTPRAGGTGSGGVATEAGASGAGGVGTDRAAALGVAGGGGAGGDYAAYYARLRQRIQDVLRYPAAARRRGVTGTVHLEIAVEPNGAIGVVSVITSSSHDILDRAAVDAARAIPRVPFPGDVRPRALRVRLPVVFELQ